MTEINCDTVCWRESGSDFLTFFDDEKLHNIDYANGDGLLGPRGSGLSALGGAVRSGELSSGIDHAVAMMFSSRRYSKDVHYLWPASTADSYASYPFFGYGGNNPYYTMGTLLAIPYDVDIDSLRWNTRQGHVVAKAAQTYGWYIVDCSTGAMGGNSFAISIERQAAYEDLGLVIDPVTKDQEVDSNKINIEGFQADIIQILQIVKAVNNIKQADMDKGEW